MQGGILQIIKDFFKRLLSLFYVELKREADIWKRSADRLPFVSAEQKTVKLLLLQKAMTLRNIVRNMKRNT